MNSLTVQFRLQNRLAQRNHRMLPLTPTPLKVLNPSVDGRVRGTGRRVRESNQDTENQRFDAQSNSMLSNTPREGLQLQASNFQNVLHIPGESLDHCASDLLNHNLMDEMDPSASQALLSSPMLSLAPHEDMAMNDSYIMDSSLPPHGTSWPYPGSAMEGPVDPDRHMAQPRGTDVFQSCSCNGTSGPCPAHIERIRAQGPSDLSSNHRQAHPRPSSQASLRRPRYVLSAPQLDKPSSITHRPAVHRMCRFRTPILNITKGTPCKCLHLLHSPTALLPLRAGRQARSGQASPVPPTPMI